MSCGFNCKTPLDPDTACRECMNAELERLREEITDWNTRWREQCHDDGFLEAELKRLRKDADQWGVACKSYEKEIERLREGLKHKNTEDEHLKMIREFKRQLAMRDEENERLREEGRKSERRFTEDQSEILRLRQAKTILVDDFAESESERNSLQKTNRTLEARLAKSVELGELEAWRAENLNREWGLGVDCKEITATAIFFDPQNPDTQWDWHGTGDTAQAAVDALVAKLKERDDD